MPNFKKNDGFALHSASEELQADPFLKRLSLENRALQTLPRLYRYLLVRHRQEKATKVAAKVDKWLIERQEDPFSTAVKQQRSL